MRIRQDGLANNHLLTAVPNGSIYDDSCTYGLRPCMTLYFDIKVIGGDGTSSNPYQITESKMANKTYDGKQYSYSNPIIPLGFNPINDGTSWKNRATDYNKGLVIEDKCGNQFVWVPIIPGSNDYKAYYTKGRSYYGQEDMNFDTSTKYGGFWVARYEAGNSGGNVISKKGVPTWTNVTYTNAKAIAENFCKANGTDYSSAWRSGLMTGKAWDTMLKWMEVGGKNVNDSRNWGNNKNSISPANVSGYGSKQNTGFSEYWKAKNIYDVAGNVWAWTYETNGSIFSYRGGDYGGNGSVESASCRHSRIASGSFNYIGFRLQLYLN